MSYIGQKPADKLVTSSDMEDGIVTTAKIADSSVTSAKIVDATIATADVANDAITLTKMASGTDGNIISYDASGNPVAVATGTDGQVLTSTGAGSPPAFETLASAANTPAFLAYRSSSNQAATSSGYTKVQLNSELFDTNTAFDSSTNYRFTVPAGEGGKYVFSLTSTIYNIANDVDYNGISLYKNGSQYVFVPHSKNSPNGFQYLHTSTTFIENASASDYYEMYVYAVGSSPLIFAGDKATFFGGYKLIT